MSISEPLPTYLFNVDYPDILSRVERRVRGRIRTGIAAMFYDFGHDSEVGDLIADLRAGRISPATLYRSFDVLVTRWHLMDEPVRQALDDAGLSVMRIAGRDVGAAVDRWALRSTTSAVAADVRFDPTDPSLISELRRTGDLYWDQLLKETARAFRDEIERSYYNNDSAAQMADRLELVAGLSPQQAESLDRLRTTMKKGPLQPMQREAALFNISEQMREQRSDMIMRTELHRIANAGVMAYWQQMARKGALNYNTALAKWETHLDERTCPTCGPLDGTMVVMGGQFAPGVLSPPLHPHCRCAISLEYTVDPGSVRYDDDVEKADHDGDGDGWVDDGKPTMRPAVKRPSLKNKPGYGPGFKDPRAASWTIKHGDTPVQRLTKKMVMAEHRARYPKASDETYNEIFGDDFKDWPAKRAVYRIVTKNGITVETWADKGEDRERVEELTRFLAGMVEKYPPNHTDIVRLKFKDVLQNAELNAGAELLFPGDNIIVMSSKVFNEGRFGLTTPSGARSRLTGQVAEYILAHEYGHTLDWDKRISKHVKMPAKGKYNSFDGIYASTSDVELWAETFAEVVVSKEQHEKPAAWAAATWNSVVDNLRGSLKKAHDGDGDGWVDDGKPTMRPAPVGRAVRAAQKVAHEKKPAAVKHEPFLATGLSQDEIGHVMGSDEWNRVEWLDADGNVMAKHPGWQIGPGETKVEYRIRSPKGQIPVRQIVRHTNTPKGEKEKVWPGEREGIGDYVETVGPIPYVYRVVSEADYQRMKKQGFLDTDGRGNISADEGLVADSDLAWTYLGDIGGMKGHDNPTGKGRALRIKVRPEDGWAADSDGYVKTRKPVPFDQVDMVSQPIGITRRIEGDPQGSHTVHTDWDYSAAPLNVYVKDDPSKYGEEVMNRSVMQPSGSPVRGTPIDPVLLPETLYHVTLASRQVAESGRLRAGGTGGLQGDENDKIVSLTGSKKIADSIKGAMKILADVALDTPESVDKGDHDAADGMKVVEAFREAAAREGWVWDPVVHEFQLTGYTFRDWANQFMWDRESKGGKKNPIFFGVTRDYWANVNPRNIGVVEVNRDDIVDTEAMVTDFDASRGGGLDEYRVYGDVPIKRDRITKRRELRAALVRK